MVLLTGRVQAVQVLARSGRQVQRREL